MHELSIAESIVDAVRKELLAYPNARPKRVGLRIGELAAIDTESLIFCFESVVRDTDMESLTLDIQRCPPLRVCTECNSEFVVIDYNSACTNCGSLSTLPNGGDELDFDYLECEFPEVEPDEHDRTPAAQVQSSQ